eukprot:scaffold10570_cov18-Tisochrysis_lutea.AAC.6
MDMSAPIQSLGGNLSSLPATGAGPPQRGTPASSEWQTSKLSHQRRPPISHTCNLLQRQVLAHHHEAHLLQLIHLCKLAQALEDHAVQLRV